MKFEANIDNAGVSGVIAFNREPSGPEEIYSAYLEWVQRNKDSIITALKISAALNDA